MVKTRLALCAMVALAGAACTVNSTDVPDLVGPSEFAKSFRITANPDSITQDGASQSMITVTTRDENGAAVSGQQIRLEISPPLYGTLSGSTVVTGSDGRATAMYTAPPAPPFGSILGACSPSGVPPFLPGPCVAVLATLLGTSGFTQGNFGTNAQVVEIHLLPLVVIPNPDLPTAAFTFFPAAPTTASQVIFNASGSFPGPGRTIISYDWNWGDGETAEGMVEDHDFPVAGTYIVTLIVTDDAGNKGGVARAVVVAAGAAPPPATP